MTIVMTLQTGKESARRTPPKGVDWVYNGRQSGWWLSRRTEIIVCDACDVENCDNGPEDGIFESSAAGEEVCRAVDGRTEEL